ncbi:uncharacterized protein SPAPADRAFT_51485 [Spathaspora passalidarum NRRL Y-27907]|uniref:Uncharacterized protein n=1 Tax=Spathaspora passalidarum (strain NRRL Y-27907 / 11-Y1) TaxID=619300 RepID=G3AQC8_SPAPN|nr:uncharacterized protein SPAPADRAFT_51485 [Spathaspora passalidarum NRRL Y-27907]EGW31475.1 hypothetical protein SPAPADRAFT_51485 [Spathaspora passalidarum NRRL Y-27907]
MHTEIVTTCEDERPCEPTTSSEEIAIVIVTRTSNTTICPLKESASSESLMPTEVITTEIEDHTTANEEIIIIVTRTTNTTTCPLTDTSGIEIWETEMPPVLTTTEVETTLVEEATSAEGLFYYPTTEAPVVATEAPTTEPTANPEEPTTKPPIPVETSPNSETSSGSTIVTKGTSEDVNPNTEDSNENVTTDTVQFDNIVYSYYFPESSIMSTSVISTPIPIPKLPTTTAPESREKVDTAGEFDSTTNITVSQTVTLTVTSEDEPSSTPTTVVPYISKGPENPPQAQPPKDPPPKVPFEGKAGSYSVSILLLVAASFIQI